MTDLSRTIIPKSDQLNADSLLAGPITVKVTSVRLSGEAEQPIVINYEGDEGRPFKPCKSMRRVLVHCWGTDGNAFAGRSMTLYCDPKVKWGGMAVGGIRISHMTDIDRDITMALTETKQSRKPFTVRPLHVALGPSRHQLEADATKAAGEGVEAFRAWHKTLSPEDRAYLKPSIGTYQQVATRADAPASEPSPSDAG